MPFKKGESGNKTGRPKQTQQQKDERESFKRLLAASTVSALESIIAISQDRYSKDKFNACKYIIDKAFGANIAFLMDGDEDEHIIIEVLPFIKEFSNSAGDRKAAPRDNDLEYFNDNWAEE